MRRVHKEGVSDFNIHLVDVYNAKKMVSWQAFSPSFAHVSLAPKTHFPFPLKCLPHRLSDVSQSLYHFHCLRYIKHFGYFVGLS